MISDLNLDFDDDFSESWAPVTRQRNTCLDAERVSHLLDYQLKYKDEMLSMYKL